MRVFSGLMGPLLAILVGISNTGAHSESTLSVTASMFGLPLLLTICCISHSYSLSCLGFVLYFDASQFVDVAELVLRCLNQSLFVVQPTHYASTSGTFTGSKAIVAACDALHTGWPHLGLQGRTLGMTGLRASQVVADGFTSAYHSGVCHLLCFYGTGCFSIGSFPCLLAPLYPFGTLV